MLVKLSDLIRSTYQRKLKVGRTFDPRKPGTHRGQDGSFSGSLPRILPVSEPVPPSEASPFACRQSTSYQSAVPIKLLRNLIDELGGLL